MTPPTRARSHAAVDESIDRASAWLETELRRFAGIQAPISTEIVVELAAAAGVESLRERWHAAVDVAKDAG